MAQPPPIDPLLRRLPAAVEAAAALQPLRALQAGEGMASPGAAGPPLWQLLDEAAQAVRAVRDGASLNDVLARVPAAQRPGVQALSFHGLRWLGSATELRGLLAPKAPPPAVDALLLLSLALLWPGEAPPYPEHTLVDQAVTAVRRKAAPAAGFVNAVLRRFLREREALVAAVRRQPLGAWNHPLWWVERIRHDWPQHWQALLTSANERPPMTLRVNARRSSGAAYVQRLAAAGRAATLLPGPLLGGQAVQLAQPCPVPQLPGFAEGEVSVQDAAAQQAAGLLLGGAGLAPGARVLDACAAPGGKTAQLLERAQIDLLALDSDARRLQRVQETLQRLGLPADGLATGGEPEPASRWQLKAADARQTPSWWDGRPFDAILLDAPCTASGIVRRHPDIRWLRRPDDIAALARVQAELLDALWPLLKPGGRLVYATCSVFRAEGQAQIDAFLQRLPAGAARLDAGSPGHLLPLADNPSQRDSGLPAAPAVHDGFYLALLHKT
jgi:16S rRNA (cytosine967-C5)-methyltransferase